MSILIRQAKVIDRQSEYHNKVVDVLIENGKISDIAKSISKKAKKEISIKGLHLSQGFTDVFADYREPGYEHKETLATGMKAAAAGGFTQVFLVPNTSPSVSSKSVLQYILKKTEDNIVSVYPLGSITQEVEGKQLAEMLDMRQYGAVAFTDGWKPVQNAALLLKALEYVKAFEGIVLQMPMDASLASGGLMHEGQMSTRLGMAGVPTLAETVFLHRDIELLRYTNSRLHITGISTAEGVEMVRKAKKEKLNITCSVTPYHLALTDEALQYYDSAYKVAPVLRSEKDRQALIKALNDGIIDCIASHHRPQEWDAKAKEFEYASEGMNIQENAFSIVRHAVGDKVALERIIDALTTRPQEIFPIKASSLAKGKEANISLFLPDEMTTVEEKGLQSMSRNNPFIGKQLKGKVVGIIHHHQSSLNI